MQREPAGRRLDLGGQEVDADVLVIGGGPAGTWAAWRASALVARVVLADKGYCGTSGATAASGTGVWWVPPDPARRRAALLSRETMGGFLADRAWAGRVLETTYDQLARLAERGYPFADDAAGNPRRDSLQGPEYMRLMRRLVRQARVTILDHCPALELLVDDAGAVAGAAGQRRADGSAWVVRAPAVVLATGGCAFLSKALGCNVLTGDGQLMAAEAGAELSGMEFSNAFGIAPHFSSVTKGALYNWASFTYEDGGAIPDASSKYGRSRIARAMLEGPVYAQLDKAQGDMRRVMREAQPNFFLPFDRAGIDPFERRFQVTMRLEGTVRGTGGLRIVDEHCATTVPGLFAAGDAATRELLCGAFTGGGSHNAAWAICSGSWAGGGAAAYARGATSARRGLRRAGGVGLLDRGARAFDPASVTQAVQAEVFPLDRNYFRSGDRLADSLGRLDALWSQVRGSAEADQATLGRTREAAAMLATARWMYRSALERTESRGMHKREDHPALDPAQRNHVVTGGLDEVWVARRPAAALTAQEVAA
jgi:succinate dehydrogenase/fumarate reductase flavoprotein subunit